MLNRQEMINLAMDWERVATMPHNDYLTRRMAERTANWFWELLGLSESVVCRSCGGVVDTGEGKRYLARFGECATCQEVKADIASINLQEQKE